MLIAEPRQVLAVARDAASAAARLLTDGFRTGVRVERKGTIDFVTEYDLRAQALIEERIRGAFPDHRFIAEETAGDDEEETSSSEYVWYVDPLDGTTNFAHGHPFFCVSIALYREQTPLLGVVHAPALGCEWWGLRGEGAFRNGGYCRVSQCHALTDALAATGFPYKRREITDNNVREFNAFILKTSGIRRCGSAAIDLCLVADGTYDFYWEQHLSAWDMCAGAMMVTEAGGQLSDYRGGPADPRQGCVVASNGHLHREVLAILREARRDLEPGSVEPGSVEPGSVEPGKGPGAR